MGIKKLKYALICIIILAFSSCNKKEVFDEFYSFQDASWNKNLICRFDVEIKDTISAYDIMVEVRNNEQYNYRNLWLFISSSDVDGNVREDTINCELADNEGKWHGKGVSLFSLNFPYEQSIHYTRSGTYIYRIRQGMRVDDLKGISDIGVHVIKK